MKTLCILLIVVSAFAADTNSAHLRRNSHHHKAYNYGTYGYPAYSYPAYSYPAYGYSAYGAYPVYSYPVNYGIYGYNRFIEENPFLDKKAKDSGSGDFVIPSPLPDLKAGDKAVDELAAKLEKNSEVKEGKLVFVGMNVQDDKARFHKVVITKTSDGKVKVETPDDVFTTLPFSLSAGDEKSTVEDGNGTPARLLYINQNNQSGNFFDTQNGKLGIVDFKALDVNSLAEAEAAIDDFLQQSHEHLKLCFSNLFGTHTVKDTLESSAEKDEKENEKLKEKLESHGGKNDKETEKLKEDLESHIEKDKEESEKLKEKLENDASYTEGSEGQEALEANIEKDTKELENLQAAQSAEDLKEAIESDIDLDKEEVKELEKAV